MFNNKGVISIMRTKSTKSEIIAYIQSLLKCKDG